MTGTICGNCWSPDVPQGKQPGETARGREARRRPLTGRTEPRPDSVINGLDGLAGAEPTPEFAAMVAEGFSRLLEMLNDETLQTVALRRLEGYTSEEIASELGCAARTVANKLKIIRLKWEHAHGPGRNDQK